MTTDFSLERMQVRRKWDNIFKILKEKNANLPAQIAFKNKGKQTFSDTQTLKEFITSSQTVRSVRRSLSDRRVMTRDGTTDSYKE